MTTTQDLFLTADERYEIWEIKQVERPSLLEFCKEVSSEDANEGNDDVEEVLPIIDGCDLPGWRSCNLVPIGESLSSVLNVGSGCPFLRRESQLPMVPSSSLLKWRRLQKKFLEDPPKTAKRIAEEDAIQLGHHPWFEKENVPVILEGLTCEWKAMASCRWQELLQNFGDYFWRFSDTHVADMTLLTYKKYMETLEGLVDDAPLGVYDSQLSNDERTALLKDYTVPKCFDVPDLFEDLGEEERPPYRWILIGPPRSGTGLHIDPMGTHAWVTVVEGLKRWVLFPRGTDRATIGMLDVQIPSALWFESWYDRALESVPGAVEILQRPGETVYVPAGWPHLVLNLERTVAITQNYATEYPSMESITSAVEKEEPELYIKWMNGLAQTRPELVQSSLSGNCSNGPLASQRTR